MNEQISALARIAAQEEHDQAVFQALRGWPGRGHEGNYHAADKGFETCPHPQCVLVRQTQESAFPRLLERSAAQPPVNAVIVSLADANAFRFMLGRALSSPDPADSDADREAARLLLSRLEIAIGEAERPAPAAEPTKEICICAAILTEDGTVIRGHRHDDCLRTIEKMSLRYRHGDGTAQGFVTSTGRYVNRKEAARLQREAGIPSAYTQQPIAEENHCLFSEDLYFNHLPEQEPPPSVAEPSAVTETPTRIGIRVVCATCGRTKTPIGRSSPLTASYCNDECSGYRQPPFPGSLWPGETSEEFGYPVGDDGTVAAPPAVGAPTTSPVKEVMPSEANDRSHERSGNCASTARADEGSATDGGGASVAQHADGAVATPRKETTCTCWLSNTKNFTYAKQCPKHGPWLADPTYVPRMEPTDADKQKAREVKVREEENQPRAKAQESGASAGPGKADDAVGDSGLSGEASIRERGRVAAPLLQIEQLPEQLRTDAAKLRKHKLHEFALESIAHAEMIERALPEVQGVLARLRAEIQEASRAYVSEVLESAALRTARDAALQELKQWRGWAQFVYLGCGPVTLSDADQQKAVCETHDKQVATVTKERDAARDALIALQEVARNVTTDIHSGACLYCGMRLPAHYEWCSLGKLAALLPAAEPSTTKE